MSKFEDNRVFIKYKKLGIKVNIRTVKYLDFGDQSMRPLHTILRVNLISKTPRIISDSLSKNQIKDNLILA
jgi:hypothetical protein